MTNPLYGQWRERHASLTMTLADLFAARPTLGAVAEQLLSRQWAVWHLPATLDPLHITVRGPVSDQAVTAMSLAQAVIQRSTRKTTYNLTPDHDFLTLEQGAEFPQALTLDLHRVELLINACGAVLLDEYKQALVAFWNRALPTGQTPLSGIEQWLQQHFVAAIAVARASGRLTVTQQSRLAEVARYPSAADRLLVTELAKVTSYLLGVPSGEPDSPGELMSSLIISGLEGEQNDQVYVYDLSGYLQPFGSLQALLSLVGQRPEGPATACSVSIAAGNMFEAQARLLLEQQLHWIDRLGAREDLDADAFSETLDSVISMQAIGQLQVTDYARELSRHLPEWLLNARKSDQDRYLQCLKGLAQVPEVMSGRSYLEGIPAIEVFTQKRLQQQMLQDHPDAQSVAIEQIEVLNHEVIGTALGSAGNLMVQGTIKTSVRSLTQLALDNLESLRPGALEVRTQGTSALPEWFDVDYVRHLVRSVDAGGQYQALLATQLRDDSAQVELRYPLFRAQWYGQLPLLALEYTLRGACGFTEAGYALAVALTSPSASSAPTLSALAFVSEPGVSADRVQNAYLIEPSSPGPLLLFRPLHATPLMQFASRKALLERIVAEPVLQADILSRLAEEVRPVYDHGGFTEPHLRRVLLEPDFQPIETPAPVVLSSLTLPGEAARQVYEGTVEELLRIADRQSVSNAEDRAAHWQTLSWLLFNTLLPFVRGPLAAVGWALSFAHGVQQLNGQTNPAQLAPALLDLLFSLMFVLESLPLPARPLAAAIEQAPEAPETPIALHIEDAPAVLQNGTVLNQLDFSWSSAQGQLSRAQSQALARMRSPKSIDALGSPDADGIYSQLHKTWVQLGGDVYPVRVDEEGVRILDSRTPDEPGPWLRRQADGSWTLDLRLRLRGGMPGHARMRAAQLGKQARIAELQGQLTNQRAQLQMLGAAPRHAEALSGTELADLIERLRQHDVLIGQVITTMQTLNELSAVSGYRRIMADMLRQHMLVKGQLSSELRLQRFAVKQLIDRLVESVRGRGGLPALLGDHTAPERALLERYCAKQQSQVAEIAETTYAMETLAPLLEKALPDGPRYLVEIQLLQAGLSSSLAWRGTQLYSIALGIMLKIEDSSTLLLEQVIPPAKLACRLRIDAQDPAFSAEEQVGLLDNAVRNYQKSLDTLDNYRQSLELAEHQAWLAPLHDLIQKLLDQALHELAAQITQLPKAPKPKPGPSSRGKTLIRTRGQRLVIGQRRAEGRAGQPAIVDVLDPIENTVITSYEQTSDASLWRELPTTTVVRPAAQAAVALRTLLARADTLLRQADQSMARAQAQAMTAQLPSDMEDLLVLQARPLIDLYTQIDAALVRDNATDEAWAGQSVEQVNKALWDKSEQMRQAGKRIRIEMIKRQLPTAARMAYLHEQNEITIARTVTRKPLKDKQQRLVDYLDEYEIRDKDGEVLWYAHFHYASTDAAERDFSAAHVKTREQRRQGLQWQKAQASDGRHVIAIYRAKLDKKTANDLFLSLP
uniref:dermonecrotic toxin domain-containing protein n=1 Tax=Pseudomonas laurentiana TaxID=2364649 RepID=UPI0029C95942|nr:DUF6543 domain-containing protein [Pseudomonas laurentiana]